MKKQLIYSGYVKSKLLIAYAIMSILILSCQKEKIPGPEITGTYAGPIEVIKSGSVDMDGNIRGSSEDINLLQKSENSIEISGTNFVTFTLTNLEVSGNNWSKQEGENTFYYHGNTGGKSGRALLIHWKSNLPDGGTQTIIFGGKKK